MHGQNHIKLRRNFHNVTVMKITQLAPPPLSEKFRVCAPRLENHIQVHFDYRLVKWVSEKDKELERVVNEVQAVDYDWVRDLTVPKHLGLN